MFTLSRKALLVLVGLTILPLAPSASAMVAQPTATQSGSSGVATGMCPLTGEPASATLQPSGVAVAVKVDNAWYSRPQAGLAWADIVFESLVEGGITRFTALYDCRTPLKVGPVRSARYDDPVTLAPYTNVLAAAGGNRPVRRRLRNWGVNLIDEASSGSSLYRSPPGSQAINTLFANVERLRGIAYSAGAPSTPYSAFWFDRLPADLPVVRGVDLRFSSINNVQYRWVDGSWRRYQNGRVFYGATGMPITADNVLVQRVDTYYSSITDVTGVASPDMDLGGSGQALLFRNGRVIRGSWSGEAGGRPIFTSIRNRPFRFAPGRTWIELVPSSFGDIQGAVSYF